LSAGVSYARRVVSRWLALGKQEEQDRPLRRELSPIPRLIGRFQMHKALRRHGLTIAIAGTTILGLNSDETGMRLRKTDISIGLL
jgi:hypothetical protein